MGGLVELASTDGIQRSMNCTRCALRCFSFSFSSELELVERLILGAGGGLESRGFADGWGIGWAGEGIAEAGRAAGVIERCIGIADAERVCPCIAADAELMRESGDAMEGAYAARAGDGVGDVGDVARERGVVKAVVECGRGGDVSPLCADASEDAAGGVVGTPSAGTGTLILWRLSSARRVWASADLAANWARCKKDSE